MLKRIDWVSFAATAVAGVSAAVFFVTLFANLSKPVIDVLHSV